MSSASRVGSPDLRRRQSKPSLGKLSGDVNGIIRVKKEPEEDIKDFAETTMNELLGWYGYDKVNTGEAKGINLSLSRFSSSSSPPQEGSESEDGSRDTTESRVLTTEADSAVSHLASGGGGIVIECSWCSKSGLKLFTLKTSGGEPKAFCSELCFNQCRRATFKKSRICDWCKHVRHTVNYVDFQDGAHQLQFCGDKCLNQYKMHIFCKETQAYLQMHPHLQDVSRPGADSAGAGSKLITPDLWLRDCKDGVNGGGRGSFNHSDEEAEPSAGSSSTGDQEESFAVHRSSDVVESSSKTSDNVNPSAFNIWEKIENHRKEFNKVLKTKDISRRSSKQSTRSSVSILRRPIASATSPKPHLPPQARVRSPLSPVHNVQMNGSPQHARASPNLQPPRAAPPSSPSLLQQPHSQTSSNSSSSSVPANIPPPPPLINSELFRPPLPPHFYHPSLSCLSQQQQLEYFLRTQGMRLGVTPPPPPPAHFPQPNFPSPFLQPPNPMPPHSFGSNSLVPPPTIMIPYPVIIPLPLPIPIPIPIPLLGMKKTITGSSEENPEQNSSDPAVPSITETQEDITPTEDCVNLTVSSPRPQMEENIVVDVEEVKEAEVTDSKIHSPPVHVQRNDPPTVRFNEGQSEQPMALTRSKSKNIRGHATSRETKRPRLMDRHGL